MLFIKESKTGVGEELAKFIDENRDNIDMNLLYELERVYNQIEETALEFLNQDELGRLEDEVWSLGNQNEELEIERDKLLDKVADLETENEILEKENRKLEDGLEEVKDIILGIPTKKQIVGKIDSILGQEKV